MNSLNERASKIKAVICDVDGVLTNGTINISATEEIFKSFNVKDGLGIKMLMFNGIEVAILTARSSSILSTRMKELGVETILQGQRNKLIGFQMLLKELNITSDEVAYIGDDLPDLAVMKKVGLAACPNDASSHIKRISHYISSFDGGCGAVRDVVELLLHAQNKLEWTIDRMFLNPQENSKHHY